MLKKIKKSTLAILAAGIILPLILAFAFVFTPKREKLTAEAATAVTMTVGSSTYNYDTLNDAFTAVNSTVDTTSETPAKIRLLSNITVDVSGGTYGGLQVGTYDWNNNVVTRASFIEMDLNGYVLDYVGTIGLFSIKIGSSLTINDSNPNAVHRFTKGSTGLYTLNEASGNIKVNGGIITKTGTQNTDPIIQIGGSFIMNKGNIVGMNVTIGGGILYLTTGNAVMNGGSMQGNTSGNDNGGAVNVMSGSSFKMTGGTISNNSPKGDGGGVFVQDGTFEMSDGEISNNSATSSSNNVYGYGGGVCVNKGTFTMTGGTISDNIAETDGGGVYIGSSASAEITGGTISGNQANSGGGIYGEQSNSIKIGSVSIEDNTASQGGGGFYVEGCPDVSFDGTKVSNNCSDLTNGGGIEITDSTVTFKNVTISDNNAQGDGGGIYTSSSAQVTFEGTSTVSNNTVNGNGGGICNTDSSVFTFKNGLIAGNEASDGVGVALYDYGKFYFENGTITGHSSSGQGLGVFVGEDCTLNISGGTISGNSNEDATGGGVYVYNNGTAVMTGGKITGNKASLGGGVCVAFGGTLDISGNAVIDGARIPNEDTLPSNVYLASGSKIACTKALATGAKIGITLADGRGVFTSGYSNYTAPLPHEFFYSDVGDCVKLNNSSDEAEIGTHSYNSIITTQPKCTKLGLRTYTCQYCDDTYTENIPYLGHDYEGVEPVWTWADNGQSVTAKITCKRAGCTESETGHVLSETATVANGKITSAVKVAATCTTKGTTTYTAKVALNGTEYTSTKDVEDIAVLGHTIDGITVSGPTTKNYTAFETIATDELSVYTHCETCKQNVEKLNFGADGYSVVYNSGNYLNVGDATVNIKYASYAEVEISGLNVSAKETDVIWEYYDGSNWLPLPAGKSYVYDPDKGIATELRARIVNVADSGEKTFRADNALVICKKGGVTQSEIKDVGTYTLALDADNSRFGNYDLRGNSSTVEITSKEIDLNAVNAFYWRLKDLSSHLRTGYIDTKDYNYYTEGGDGRTYVVRSIVRDRGREIEILLNGTETDRYTISYENNKATSKGQYTSIANLVMTDPNYKFVCNGTVDGDRHILFEITDGGNVAKVTKEWYIAKIDNGLKSQHDPDYGEEWSITGWKYGEYEMQYAPRLEHGDTGEYKSVIDFSVSDNGLVTFDLYYKAVGSEEVEIATGFSRADFNKYINGSMPAGEYRLVVHAKEFNASEGHIHWYDGTPHDTTSGELGSALYFAPFNRQFDFEVSTGTMTANVSELSESYTYTYNGEMQVYGDFVLTVGDQPEREGEWANGKYDAYYSGAEMQFNLKRWNTGNYLTMLEMELRENKSSKPVNADEYTLYYRVVAKNYVNLGGTEADFFKVIINKAKVEKPENKEVTYNGSAYTYDVAAGVGYYVSGTATYTNANEDGYDITLKLDDSDNYKWESTDGDSVTVKLIIHKAEVAVPASQTVDYNGAPQNYTVDGDAPYTVTSGAYTDANEEGYAVTLTLKAPDNYKWADESAVAQVKLIIKPVKQEPSDTEGHVHVWSHAIGHNGDVHYVECLSCGERKDVAEHEYNWVLDTAPTTETTGIKHEECPVCGHRRSDGTEIPKLEASHTHTMEHVAEVPATCTKMGVKEYWHCTGCKKDFADEEGYLELTDSELVIPAKGHRWSTDWESDTASHWHKCTDCGERKDEAEHDYNWVLDTAPTTESTGLKHEECSVCGHRRSEGTEIPKLDASHSHKMEHVAEVPATCTEVGVKEYWHCTGCKKDFADEEGYLEITDSELVIPAKGHRWSESYTGGSGGHWFICLDCEERKGIQAHDYNWVLDRAPTTESTGLKHEECSICGHKRNVGTEIAKLDENETHTHNLVRVRATTATCTNNGNREYWHCSTCNKDYFDREGYLEVEKEYVTRPATGHIWSEEWESDSTSHWHVCLICGEKQMTEHSYVWKTDKEPTKESDGSKHEECTVCGHKRSEGTLIDRLPADVVVPSGEKDNSVPWWVWLLISLCVVAVGAGVTSLILIRRNAKKNAQAATVAVPAENSNSDVIMQRLNEHEEKIDELMNRDDGGFGDMVNPDELGGDGLDGGNNN